MPPASTSIQPSLMRLLLRFGQTVRLCIAVPVSIWRHPTLGRRLRRIAGLQALAGGALALLLMASPFGPGLPRTAAQLGDAFGQLTLLLVLSHMVVLGLTFEFHDDLTRRASLWLHVPPEDPDQRPRLRFNPSWVSKRIRRRWRGWVLMTVGVAMLAPLTIFNRALHAAATAGWTLYWIAIFALGKSAAAWREPIHRAPWLIRLKAACERQPVLYALPFTWIAFGLQGLIHNLWAPMVNAEEHPAESLGLAGLHALSNVPLLGFFLRPWVALCAAMLVDEGPEAALERVRQVSMGLSPLPWEDTEPPKAPQVDPEPIDAIPLATRPQAPGAPPPRDTPAEVPAFAVPHDTPAERPRFEASRATDAGTPPPPQPPGNPRGLTRR